MGETDRIGGMSGRRDSVMFQILALALALAALPDAVAAQTAPQSAAATPKTSRAFRGLSLGMDRDSALAAIKADDYFAYRGPEDVSLLPSPNQSLIEVAGLSFVKRAYFQFVEGRLWVMIIDLNPARVDHYSIFSSLSAKYGEPSLLDPKEARWEDATTRMALERPLTLRYMDMAEYGKLREGAQAKASATELDRRDFLGGL